MPRFFRQYLAESLPVFAPALAAFAFLSAQPARSAAAQEVRIRVLNARSGKPIANECLNILFPGLKSGLTAPTNNDGFAVFHFLGDQATADALPNNKCRQYRQFGPIRLPPQVDGFIAFGNLYVVCEEVVARQPDDSLDKPALEQIYPIYRLRTILSSGITAGNTCGKARAAPTAGVLTLFARPRSFFERLWQ